MKLWVFDARNEKHVRKLLEEAQAAGHTNVAGYKLRSIEQVPGCCHCGNTLENHGTYEGHGFVPMGCDCLRSTPSGETKS